MLPPISRISHVIFAYLRRYRKIYKTRTSAVISSNFDPYGFIEAIIITVKLLVQSLYLKNNDPELSLNRDYEVTENFEFSSLNLTQVPRWSSFHSFIL